MVKQKKTRNYKATDLTRINLDALKKRVKVLEEKVLTLEALTEAISRNVYM